MSLLYTRRLKLRPVTEEDAVRLHGLLVMPRVRRHLLDGDEVALAFAQQLVRTSRESFDARGFGFWAAEAARTPGAVPREPEDVTRLVGLVGLRPQPPQAPEGAGGPDGATLPLREDPPIELLYAIHPARWGQGLAVEASRAVLAYAFDACRLERVVAETDEANRGSLRVLEKLGMQRVAAPAQEDEAPPPPGRLRFELRRGSGYAAC